MREKIEWTNPSVKKLAGKDDPIKIIVEKTKQMLLKAMDDGWGGPPYDPMWLAKYLAIQVTSNEDIPDARIIPDGINPRIEYNPHRSRRRIRFSLAHEIAHTLFPDYEKSIHNRSGKHKRIDDWQIELLCNRSAAEILMPVGSLVNPKEIPVTMENVIRIRNKYDVSAEAVLLQLINQTSMPVAMFSAAKINDEENSLYRIEYVVSSSSSTLSFYAGLKISSKSVLSECSAIGYTSKRKEKLFQKYPKLDVECIGVFPSHNSIYPRVLCIIKLKQPSKYEPQGIIYLSGDATDPHGSADKIIVHIVNDKSKRWGKGFGLMISKKWPALRKEFVRWAEKRNNLRLGKLHLFKISDQLLICSMIAQRGYAESTRPKIRYQHLASCLELVALEAKKNDATVHMPRIGTGFAGGDWKIISSLIDEYLIREGVKVTVYDLPNKEKSRTDQNILDYVQDGL